MPQFQAGQSGNPGGRPKADQKLRDLCQARGEELFNLLWGIANDDTYEQTEAGPVPAVAPKDRIAAIKILLDRGYGRPRQEVEITGQNTYQGRALVTIMQAPRPGQPSPMIKAIAAAAGNAPAREAGDGAD